jgi:hypothetical protein
VLSFILLYVALALVWLPFLRYILQDPYRDIKAPKRNDVEIPDLTFDSRGMA